MTGVAYVKICMFVLPSSLSVASEKTGVLSKGGTSVGVRDTSKVFRVAAARFL